jgi:iron complex transport system substrate-binding protein
VVSLRPNCLDDIWRDIAKIGEHTGTSVAAERLIDVLRYRVAVIPKPAQRPRVLCVEWIDPPMTAGHWIPELIALAGGESLLAPTGGPSPYVSVEQIAAADPDVVIVAPCGFDLARTAAEMAALDRNPLWQTLRAARESRVFLADGNLYFNRPSPAVVETVEIIAEILGVAAGHSVARRFGADVWREWRGEVTTTTAPQSSRHGAAQSPL